MTKFSTNPKLNHKFIKMPVLGKVEVVDGVIDVPEDKVEELLSMDFGFKLEEVGKKKVEKVEKKEEKETVEVPLDQMKAADVRLVAQDLVTKEILTQEEVDAAGSKKDLIALINSKLS